MSYRAGRTIASCCRYAANGSAMTASCLTRPPANGPSRSSRYTCAMTRRLFLLALAATSLLAEDFTGRVVGISDGDTIRVMHEGRAERVRLWGIDTPDSGSPGASGAKQFTGDAAYGKTVTVRVRDIHRYKRTVPRLRSVFHIRTCCQPS